MAFVKVYRKDDSEEGKAQALEQALRAFKRQVEREGILKDLKKRENFIAPTVVRRNKLKEAIKREHKIRNKQKRLFRDK